MEYRHLLYEYKNLLEKEGLLVSASIPEEKTEVFQVSCDTRELTGAPSLFFCKGVHFKPEFLESAFSKGAVCYIAESVIREDLPYMTVSDVRRAMAVVGCFHYCDPSSRLTAIGLTGTKGKTTAAYFIKPILDLYEKAEGGKESAIISSVDVYDGTVKKEAHMTTPEPLDVQMHFGNAVKNGIRYLTMEVTSQALKYGRVVGVSYDVGAFLNIGYDHISSVEHPDFEDYFRSKLKLFDQCRIGCVNLDSERADTVLEYAKERCRVVTFGTKRDADVFGYDIRKNGEEIVFRARVFGEEREYAITIPGLFNVENALCAIAVCEAIGIPDRYIRAGLYKARSSGRMEVYSSSDGKVICIVDYAHNKMSFEALLTSVKKEYPGRDTVLVFGCPGKKAFNRREDLGRLAGKYSKHVIITEEDYGEEPFMQISEQIASFVEAQGCPYSIIEDRGDAIKEAINVHGDNSVILITGKGDETRQKRGTEYIDCLSDVEFTKKYLSEYDEGIDPEEYSSLLDSFGGKTLVIGGKPKDEEIKLLEEHGIKVVICDADSVTETAKKEKADRVALLLDRDGIRLDESSYKTVIGSMGAKRVSELLDAGFFEGETKKLLEEAVGVIESGAEAFAILDKSVKNNVTKHLTLPVIKGTVITR